MRWTAKPDLHDDDIVYRHQFALFPIRIDNEIRWLEHCYIICLVRYNADGRAEFFKRSFCDKSEYMQHYIARKCKRIK